jgi:signal transduction histidine kinase
MAWIGFAENNAAKSVRPSAHAGFEEGYLETLNITWADTERGRGPTGTAIRTGAVIACRNMLTDPAFAPWREEAIRRGYASSIVFPLRAHGETFGALNIYSREADPFSEAEVGLLTEVADNLAYGIQVLRTRESRDSAEKALRASEERVRRKLDSILTPEGDIGELELADIIDAPSMQLLMDNFYKLTRIPMGMIDLKGKVLVGVGWQDICTKFHRIHPESCKNCIESDTLLSAGVPRGEYKLYKCKNNMWDVATPIIVGGRHFGNFFMGQFFFEDEPVDLELFQSQAKRYNFDEKEYLACLECVPRMSRETLATGMAYFMELADMTSRTSFSNLKLARSLAERDTLMASLQKARDELEERVAERTIDLASAMNSLNNETEERLRAMEDLREKDRILLQQSRLAAMGEMINNIAHQWRQPLNLLAMNIQKLLLFYDLGEFDRELLASSTDDAMAQIRHMSQTIDDFRTFFRTDRKKSVFGVLQTVERTISLIRDGLRTCCIDVNLQIDAGITINGYENEFCQVLLNILLNARDALLEGRIPAGTITLKALAEGGRTVITVTDNAGGIPEEIIDRIFEPYFSTKGVQGTGIGLYMSKQIIETNMGGKLTARNTEDGAEFRIEL